jgi:LAO/AO transport system kinase
MMLDLSTHGKDAWRPPIVKTTAPSGAGVPEALQALEAHGAYLARSSEGARRRAVRARSRLLALLEGRFRRTIEARAPEPDGLEEAVREVTARREDPYSAAGRLFERLVRGSPASAPDWTESARSSS